MFGSFDSAVGFCTVPMPANDGFTWTLTSLMGSFLHELETQYGSRDREYTPLGIEFCGQRPQLWYPGNRKHVIIMLSDSARMMPNQAIFQLAHETVHLLSPSGARNSLTVEEGLATLFSHAVSQKNNLGVRSFSPAYDYAERKLFELMTIQPDAINVIRTTIPMFYEWTADNICDAAPFVPRALASSLCEPFASVEARFLANGFIA